MVACRARGSVCCGGEEKGQPEMVAGPSGMPHHHSAVSALVKRLSS